MKTLYSTEHEDSILEHEVSLFYEDPVFYRAEYMKKALYSTEHEDPLFYRTGRSLYSRDHEDSVILQNMKSLYFTEHEDSVFYRSWSLCILQNMKTLYSILQNSVIYRRRLCILQIMKSCIQNRKSLYSTEHEDSVF